MLFLLPYYLINTSILSLSFSLSLFIAFQKIIFCSTQLNQKISFSLISQLLPNTSHLLFLFLFIFNGEDRSIYLCKQKTKKKLGLNTGATPVGHGCQTLVNKTKRKVPSKKTSNCSFKKKNQN